MNGEQDFNLYKELIQQLPDWGLLFLAALFMFFRYAWPKLKNGNGHAHEKDDAHQSVECRLDHAKAEATAQSLKEELSHIRTNTGKLLDKATEQTVLLRQIANGGKKD